MSFLSNPGAAECYVERVARQVLALCDLHLDVLLDDCRYCFFSGDHAGSLRFASCLIT